MPRLIDADELLKHAYDSGAWKDAETGFHQRVVDVEDIENAPTVDAESVQPTEFEWCHDCKEYDQNAHCCHRWTKVIRNTVNDLITQGYQPVKYGMWEYVGGNLFRCSECHKGTADDDNILTGQANYCGVCGARMDDPTD